LDNPQAIPFRGVVYWRLGRHRSPRSNEIVSARLCSIRATLGTFIFLPPGVAHNINNVSDTPARVLMTVSPPGHEKYFEELSRLGATGSTPDPKAIGDLRAHYDTDQLSALTSKA
jgi:hypothetical protein